MALTGLLNCNQLIYAYLESYDLWKLRAVSKAIKAEVETTKHYQKYEKMAKFYAQFAETKVWNMAFKSNIPGVQPTSMHSNGKKLRVIDLKGEQIWSLDPSATTLKTQSISLKKIEGCSPRYFWNTDEVAITHSIYPKNHNPFNVNLISFRTLIFNAENGNDIAQYEDTTLFPIDWCHRQLVMQEKHQNKQDVTLFIWDYLTEKTNKPTPIISFEGKIDLETDLQMVCRDERLYYLNNLELQPFSIINLHNSQRYSLEYKTEEYKTNRRNYLKNFGVTETGNIFFSENTSFVLLNGDTAKVMANIELPITPLDIKTQFPFMICSQEYQFLVYDFRKMHQPVCQYDYLTWANQLRHLISIDGAIASALGTNPFFNTRVRMITLHNQSLFVSKGDQSIDQFDLTAGSTFLNNFKFW